MISVDQAKQLVQQHVKPLAPQKVSLPQAAGLVLAQDVYAAGNFPPFRQSSMDGYSFAFNEWQQKPLRVAGQMQAGAETSPLVQHGQAVRIFTGAPLPLEHDTVVMQEKTTIENGLLNINDQQLRQGSNARQPGDDIAQGELAMSRGLRLSPAAIGFAASMGLTHLMVTPAPKVQLLVTGKELQLPGLPLQFGQVYESNSYTLTAALKALGFDQVQVQLVDDDPLLLTSAIEKALQSAELLLVTGGVSVGDYDFVTQALQAVEANIIFHKVKQRPGKPLLFAKRHDRVIFGLPGNPSSVLTCFYQYVTLALQQLTDRQDPFVETTTAPIATDFYKNTALTHFLKAVYNGQQVTPLGGQESFKMNAFAAANCLLVLPENQVDLKKGDRVEVHLLT